MSEPQWWRGYAKTLAPWEWVNVERAIEVEVLRKVLRGLRSEDHSTQLRAIIAEVETMIASRTAVLTAVVPVADTPVGDRFLSESGGDERIRTAE